MLPKSSHARCRKIRELDSGAYVANAIDGSPIFHCCLELVGGEHPGIASGVCGFGDTSAQCVHDAWEKMIEHLQAGGRVLCRKVTYTLDFRGNWVESPVGKDYCPPVWISVNHSLPTLGENDTSDEVLVKSIKGRQAVACWSRERTWYSMSGGDQDMLWGGNPDVTHWKALEYLACGFTGHSISGGNWVESPVG